MKKLQNIVCVSIALLLLISCASTQKDSKQKASKYNSKFIELDSLQRSQKPINFNLGKSIANWYPYRNYDSLKKGAMLYSKQPKNNASDSTFLNFRLFINQDEVFDEFKVDATIDDYLSFKMNYYQKRRYKNFKYELTDFEHLKYGKGYIIMFKENRMNVKLYAEFLIFSKGKGYSLKYIAPPADFDTYLPEVTEIVMGFEIKNH